MNFVPEAARNLALAYDLAAYKLLDELDTTNSISPKTGMVKPSVLGPICGAVVLTSLSIEIALKALLQRHVGTVPRTHDHLKLFGALPPEIQTLAQDGYRRTAELRNKNSGGSQPLELLDVLAATKDAFQSWRYVYEPTELPRCMDISTATSAAHTLMHMSDTI